MNILLIRLSSMGDVALLRPLIYELLKENQKAHIHLISQKHFSPIFDDLERFTFHSFEKGNENILTFTWNLSSKHKFDLVVDVHRVLRTFFLRMGFFFLGSPTITINKRRKERRQFLKASGKVSLPSIYSIYSQPFRDLSLIKEEPKKKEWHRKAVFPKKHFPELSSSKKNILFSPLTAKRTKTLPESLIIDIIEKISELENINLLLLGGKAESATLEKLCKNSSNTQSLAGKYPLAQELDILGHSDLMICGDSSNHHLASIVGLRALSIWGGTHPKAGFRGQAQKNEDIIQNESTPLPCRPCSIYGKNECKRGDFACFSNIQVSTIINKIKSL